MGEMLSKEDQEYLERFPPDEDFDPEHNRRVIENSIEETDKVIKEKEREYDEPYRERAEAISRYLDSLKQKGGSSNIEKYFGKRYLAYLKGKDAISRIQDRLFVAGSDGKIIRRPGEVK